jgi:primary-amine oxidase
MICASLRLPSTCSATIPDLRRCVISGTVANYEYAFAWSFKQDGTAELGVKLTGILNTYTAAPGEKVDKFGTLVAPGVQAHHHQHLFCLRVDPMIE